MTDYSLACEPIDNVYQVYMMHAASTPRGKAARAELVKRLLRYKVDRLETDLFVARFVAVQGSPRVDFVVEAKEE